MHDTWLVAYFGIGTRTTWFSKSCGFRFRLALRMALSTALAVCQVYPVMGEL